MRVPKLSAAAAFAVLTTVVAVPTQLEPGVERRGAAAADAADQGGVAVVPSMRRRAPASPKLGSGAKIVRGVNLGGWFVIECWMKPTLCSPYPGAVDQWTLTQKLGLGAMGYLQNHWKTWITEADFQQIAAAGLNTVRIPVGHWTFAPSWPAEPYLPWAEMPYLTNAIKWAKKYNLDVIIDMHTAPNSVNGFDNGGRQGPIHFAKVNAADNANRLINALVGVVNQFVNPTQYGGVVKAIEVVNEPVLYSGDITQAYMKTVYDRAITAINNAVSSTAITRPTILISDGFLQPTLPNWDTYMATKPAGSVAMDTHRYQAWAPQNKFNYDGHVSYACGLSQELSSFKAKYPIIVGEFSLGYGCTTCSYSNISQSIAAQNNRTQNVFMRRFWEAQVRAYEKAGGWVWWSWKVDSYAEWSYKDSMKQGWIPANAATRVFSLDATGCPTTSLVSGAALKFATESNPPTANSTTNGTATATAPKRRAGNGELGGLALPTVTLSQLEGLVQAAQEVVSVIIAGTGQSVLANVFPLVKQLTFATGPSH